MQSGYKVTESYCSNLCRAIDNLLMQLVKINSFDDLVNQEPEDFPFLTNDLQPSALLDFEKRLFPC